MALGVRVRGERARRVAILGFCLEDLRGRRELALPRFVFPAELLQECARRVDFTRSWREQMVYLLGEVKGSRRVVRKIVQVPSVGDLTSVVDLPSALFELHTAAQDGWELLGVAHSHSEWFPVPSRRDRTTQARLELY